LKNRNGLYGSWIERLRKIQLLSRISLRTDQTFLEDRDYDSIPLPSLVVAFKEQDAIVACFDEEGQYMLERSLPHVQLHFTPFGETPQNSKHSLHGDSLLLRPRFLQQIALIQNNHAMQQRPNTECSLCAHFL
jgi:hypothetical protein